MAFPQLPLRERMRIALAPTSPSPIGLEIGHAKGSCLFGTDGTRYLDLISGIATSNVGHGHPKVVEAVRQQAERHMHLMVYGEYAQAPQVLLAEKLASMLPPSLCSAYFTNSGSEAIEGAIKLAKRATGRTALVAFGNAYHGSTNGSLSLMGNEAYKGAFYPLLPEVRHIKWGCSDSLRAIDGTVAAVFAETIQGEAGVRTASTGFFRALRKRCSDTGTLLVLDEAQCGMGRTGSMFAFSKLGIAPDILVLAKALGGGMPLGAFIASRELMSELSHSPVLGHITTFGGHPVSCAAGLAAIEVMEEEALCDAAVSCGKMISERLSSHPQVLEVRGEGLLLALQLGSSALVMDAIHRCIANGVVTDWFLFCDDAMRIAPPLTISEQELAEGCDIILAALSAAAG